MTCIGKINVRVKILHCGGTIKKLEEKYLKILTGWVHKKLKDETITQSLKQVI